MLLETAASFLLAYSGLTRALQHSGGFLDPCLSRLIPRSSLEADSRSSGQDIPQRVHFSRTWSCGQVEIRPTFRKNILSRYSAWFLLVASLIYSFVMKVKSAFPPKRRWNSVGQHDVTFQKTVLTVISDARSSNLTKCFLLLSEIQTDPSPCSQVSSHCSTSWDNSVEPTPTDVFCLVCKFC
jgi:hypothetical protein